MTDTQRPMILLTVAFAGMVALIVLELLSGSFSPGSADGMLMPLAILLSLSALPVILLAMTSARWAFWLSFVLSSLLAVFHGIHILEHAMASDHAVTLLVVFTMFAPSLRAALLLWRHRPTKDG